MRYPSVLLLLALLFSACGNDAQQKNSDAAEEAVMTTTAFTPAAEALAAGASAAEVGGMLLQAFPAVSDANTGMVDPVVGKSYVEVATQLADKYPGDTLAALPLYKAAEVVRALNFPARAADIYQRVSQEFPGFSKSGEALFMLAFTYDEDLNDMAKAKATYEQFIEQYPDHGFADDAEMLIGNLGKTDEEVLRELENRN